jgi:peptidoglycan-N-acetylglucosamine deacetylase
MTSGEQISLMEIKIYFYKMVYLVKTPGWVKKVYKNRLWEVKTEKKEIFLSFDDGPHPVHTPFVLDELRKFDAKATFFCIGKNVLLFPQVYERILDEGHAIGNHSFDHLNGWKTKDAVYLENIRKAAENIDSRLFRPPYGRISNFQVAQLASPPTGLKTIMWSVLSGDFDNGISEERCLQNVIFNSRQGSIVVFHDSDKAAAKMKFALPRVLNYFSEKGFCFSKIEQGST